MSQIHFNESIKILKELRDNWNTKNEKAFIDRSRTIDDVYENLEDYNPTQKRTVLIKFDNVIAYTEPKKKKVLLLLNWNKT